MKKPITALLLGAGLRGADAYGPYALAHPDQLRFVAVAEPDPARRARFAAAHGIPPERQFVTWQEALGRPLPERQKTADVVFNCTQDRMHEASGVAALQAGYDMLLEKPMAHDLAGTVRLVQAAEETGRLLQVCHVLRYSPFFSTVHEIVSSGRLGEVVAVTHRENVAYWHMAHSFVRGNWRNEGLSSPMILSKCCHDLDVLYWNLGEPVRCLQSFGSLRHFRAGNAPAGAPLRCTDGCPAAEQCPFDARRLYLNMDIEGWPVTALVVTPAGPAGWRPWRRDLTVAVCTIAITMWSITRRSTSSSPGGRRLSWSCTAILTRKAAPCAMTARGPRCAAPLPTSCARSRSTTT